MTAPARSRGRDGRRPPVPSQVVETSPPPDQDRPEFGPSGYLPERASKRARKIVLRAPLGLQWVIAAVVSGVAVVIAGVLFLQQRPAAPTDPWVPVATVEEVGDARSVDDLDVLLVGTGGRVRAFADAAGIAYCPASNRLETADGQVWNLAGRGLEGTPSLDEHPTAVHDGEVYLDPTRTVPGPTPLSDPVDRGCP